jgi:hypothetical protein
METLIIHHDANNSMNHEWIKAARGERVQRLQDDYIRRKY